MQTKIENPQDLSVPLLKSSTLQNQLDLNLYNVKNNTILEWNDQIIGYISIKNDTFFLKLVETAPKIIISAFPKQKQVLFEVANTIEIRNVGSDYLEVLAIEADSIYFLANAEVTKDIGLTARKSLTVSGSQTAENIHSKAASITHTGKLDARKTLTIEAQEDIQLDGKLNANTLILRGNSAVINKQSETMIRESSVIVADSVVLEGDFHPGDNLLCKSRDLTIACPVSNLGSICIETDIFQINNAGKIELNTTVGAEDIREIVARSLVVDKGGRLQANNLFLSSEHVDSQGELDLDHSKLDVKSLELAGTYSIKNGSCIVENKAVLAGNSTSVLAHLEFEAESITFFGNNKNQGVNFITDDVLFAETSAPEFTDSNLEVAYLVSLNEEATIKLKNTFVNTEAIHFSGTAILENCTMECSTLITSEKTTLDASKILAEDFWQDAGAQINNCEIKAQSTTLQQQTSLQHCKLETNMLGYEGTGYVTKSDIHVFNYIHGSKNSNLTFQHSFVKSGQNYSQGILNLTEGSYYQTDYMQQSAGSIRVNGSVIDNKELLYTFTGTTLIAESNGQLQLKTALFEGDTTWNASKMQSVGPVIFCGKITGENAVISSKDSIYFSAGQHQLEKSAIVSEKVIAASSDLTLDQSTLSCKSLVLDKDTLVKNSRVDVSDLNIVSKFCAQKSLINLKSALYAFHNSSTSLEGVKILSQSMYYGGELVAKASELIASENVNFAKASVSGFEVVKLEAGKNIINQTGSQLGGRAIEIKSKDLINHGSIAIDNFSAQTSTIRNTGEISTKQLQFRASVDMINTGSIESDYIKGQSSVFFNIDGRMHSTKSTTIQAPLCLNLFSGLVSDASLNIDSVVHFNLPGLERAFDMNIRSLLDFNYGLRLPALPGSLEDVFTLSRAMSIARMTLTQMLPAYSNIISLGTMAIPYAKKSTGFFYDFWKSDSSFSSLPYKIYDSTRSSFIDGLSVKDASDLLPVAMNIMSTGLSAAQFTRCAIGSLDEISAHQVKSAKPSLPSSEGDKAEATEKTVLTPEPMDLSNLLHIAGEIAIKTAGPSINLQTIVGSNGGVTASVNLLESTYFGSNSGVKCGWNIFGDYQHLVNRGIFAGANLTATGKSWKNSGTFVSSQKAALLFSEKLINEEGGYLNLSNFFIRSKEVLNSGSLNLCKGRLEAENLTNTGQANFFTAEAYMSENINFGETSVADFKTVKLETGKNIINQAGSRLDGTVMEIKSASLTNKGSIALENFSIRSEEVVNAGSLNLSKGKLEAEHLTSTGLANLSTVAAYVSENINFGETSVSDFQTVKLEAGESIINEVGSRLAGTALEMKSTYLTHHGSIAIDNFSAQTSTIRNSGEISTKQLQYRASVGVLNTGSIESDYIKGQSLAFLNIFGSVHSTKSTFIQAPLCLNFFSDLASDASLNIDSLFHFNILASERAFDMNIRSLLDFNYGLRLPSLPGSAEDIFTLPRAVSFSRMALTQMLPGYSNLISLGSMVIPYAKKSASYLYDFWNSDSPYSSLPYKIYDAARSSLNDFVDGLAVKDASDLLPIAMNIMSTGLGAAQFTRCATGALDEISARQDKSAKLSPEGDKAVASEKSALNLESMDLSNLLHTASEIAIKTLGPSMNIQTMGGYNGGVTASVNLTESTYNEANFGVKCGWNITGDYKHGVNRGIFAGANVIATGKTWENSGIFVSSQKTALLFSDKLTNTAGGNLNIVNFSIRSKEVVNAGSFMLSRGRLDVEHLSSSGYANLSNVAAHASENINFAGTSISNFKSVKLEAGKNIINQAGSRFDGTAMEIKSTSLTNDGSVILDKFISQSKEVVNGGNLNLSRGKLEASESIVNQAGSQLAGTALEIKSASLINPGSIALDSCLIQSKEIVNDGNLNLNRGKLEVENLTSTGHANLSTVTAHVSENINFGETSVSNFQSVRLEADKSIVTQAGSQLEGTALEIKATSLTSHGSIAIDNLSANASTIYNSGEISTKQLQYRASVGMLNTGSIESDYIKGQSTVFLNLFGRMHSKKSTMIQAPLLLNMIGDLKSDGSLNIDSLAHFNFLGSERAFDMNIRSLVDFNYGLRLPTLSSPLGEVFTWSRAMNFARSRAMNFARMGLAQLLPNYSNVISLGAMTFPYTQKSASYLYDFWKSDAPLSTLPQKIYDSAQSSLRNYGSEFAVKDGSDLLPIAMNIMSTGLGVKQFVMCATGALDEIKSAQQNNNGLYSSEGSSSAKSEPVEISNLFHAAGEIAIKAFGPTMNIQTVFGHNAGFTSSINLTESAFYESNYGVKYGWNIAGDYKHGVNRGIFAGANVFLTGRTWENSGILISSQKAALLFSDQLRNTDGSYLELNNFSIRTRELDNTGILNLNQGRLEAEHLTSTGEANLSAVAGKAEHVTLTGQYRLIEQSTLIAENLVLKDEGLIKQSTVIGHESIQQTGHLVAEEGFIHGKMVSLSGVEATDGKISAEQDLVITKSNTLGTGLFAENADLSHSSFKGRKNEVIQPILSEKSEAENEINTSSADKMEITKYLKTDNVLIENMQVVSGSHTDTGSTFKDSIMKSNTHFIATDSTLERTFAEACDIKLSGQTKVSESQVKAENNLEQEGTGTANDSIFMGKNIDIDGLRAEDGKIIAENHLDIKSTKTYGTAIGAKNANLKNSTFEGRETELSGDYASIGETATDNNAEPGSNQIKIENNLNTHNVVMKNMQISSTTHTDQNGTYRKTHGVTTVLKSNNSKFKDRSTYKARDIKLSGSTKVNSSALIAERELTQRGNLKGKEALLSGNNVTVDGVRLTKSTIQAEQYLKIKNANTGDTSISGKKLDLEDSVFKATPPSEESIHREPKSESDNEALANTTTSNQPEDIAFNQIHASESLNTKNVIFEGQSINAHTMTLDSSTMKSSIAKVATNTIIQNSNIGTSYIETNEANIRGNNIISETLTKARDTITFEKTGHLKTHNAEFDAVNHIMHHSNNHEQTGTLLFRARNVETTATTNLYSGKGEENAFFVQSETANFQGKMRLDNGSFEVKHLKNAEDLIGQKGQSASQEFSKSLAVSTEASITIENMKPRACDLAVKGKSIQINSDYKTDHDLDFIATDGKVKVNANVSGNKVVLKSEKSDIEVNGKTVEGRTYVYAEAARDIKVRATEREFEGIYSKEKEYFQGNIVGGSGNEDTGGAGVILKAGNKAVIDASNVIAKGKTIVSGDKGVEFKARTNEFISERKSHNKRVLGIKHGKKKTEKTETRISTSTLGSVDDQVQVISSEGAVTGVAGNFIAARGTDIYAHKDVELKSLITNSKVRKRETGAFGLNSSNKNEKHQNVKLVEFVSNGHETRLHSHTGNIQGTDLRFSGRGNVRFETPEGETIFRASKLNHSIKTSERKFSLSTPIVDSVEGMKDDKKRVIRQAEPLVRHTEALLDANAPVEMLASTTNLVVNGYNMANALIEGTYGQQLLQGIGFVPKVNLTMTQTDISSKYQTGTGAGIFLEEGDVSFVAKGAVDLEGMPIIADNLSIKADKVRMSGQSFESSHNIESTSVTVGVNVAGTTDASISHSSQQTEAKHYQNMQVQIRNHMQIEARELVLDAANMSCNTIDMKIDGPLTVQSRQDELRQNSNSASASTTGAVSMNQAHTHSRQINQAAGIHVVSGITKENMQVNEANLIGGVITTDGHNGFAPEKLNTTTLRDSSHTRGFGISGNLDSITNALNSEQGIPSQLTTVNVSHTKMDYKAQIQATVFGKEGVNSNLLSVNPDVNTSSQARRVIYDKSQTIELDVPVEVVKSSVQAGLHFFKPATQQVPTIPKEQLRISPDRVIESTEEIYETFTQSSAIQSSSEGNETILATESIVEEPDNIYIPLPTATVLENPVSEIPCTSEEVGNIRNIEVFNPDPHTQTVGLKDGRNCQQLYNKENGQYTNLEKELQISAENSHFTTSVELTLMEGGNKAEGYYYEAKIDPLANQLVINAGLGKQYTFNIDANGMDLNYFGSVSYTVDACSAQALIKTQIVVDPTSASAILGAELGIMGPSAGVSYSTPEFSLMGLTFQLTTDLSGGVGLKATGAIGGEVNINKMKASGVGKLGLFSGAGAEVKIKPSIGIDMKLPEEIHKAYQEIVEEDKYGMSIIEKMKNWEILTPHEHDYFDTMMDEVGSKAQVSRWFSK